jgi:UDP-N-acetylglucosamine 1-carboxyvinyltransferase
LASRGETILDNVPNYTDIHDLCQILRELGAVIEFVADNTLRINGEGLSHHIAPYHLARKLRGSTYVVGLLLARLGQAEVACPGGCAIGSRPIDFHLKGFQALGAEVSVERGCLVAKGNTLAGNYFYVDRASFGTTVNMIITASLAPGTTTLENAAMEPEIVDLANFLNAMGARVRGAGTNVIRVEGVKRLQGTRHEIIPDRLEAGTFLIAGAATGGDVMVQNCIPEHLRTVLVKLQETGVHIEATADGIRATATGKRIRSVDIETQPHPGFPTDLQSPFVAMMCLGDGVSVINETVFENRFGYANELIRMGANIKIDHNTAIVRGVERLTGAPVEAGDIRGGVALVIAGLSAEGTTEVANVKYVDRGYYHLEEKLSSLGAGIARCKDEG